MVNRGVYIDNNIYDHFRSETEGCALPLVDDRVFEVYLGKKGAKATVEKLRNRIHWIQSEVRGHNVLDVGTSQGVLPILLGRNGFNVIGIDINPSALKYGETALKKEDEVVQQKVEFVLSGIDDFKTKILFDTIVLGEFLEHVPNSRAALEKCMSLLCENGRIIITSPFGVFPSLDHKCTFFVSDIKQMLHGLGNISFLDIKDRYFRIVVEKEKHTASEISDQVLMAMSEDAFEIEQRRFLAEIDKNKEEINRLSQKTDMLEGKLEEASRYNADLKEKIAYQEGFKIGAEQAIESSKLKVKIDKIRSQLEKSNAQTQGKIKHLHKILAQKEQKSPFTEVALKTLVQAKNHSKQVAKKTRAKLLTLKLINNFQKYGVDNAVSKLVFSNKSSKWNSDHLIQIVQELKNRGETALALAVATKAVTLKRSEKTLRAQYWSAWRAGEYSVAKNSASELRVLYGSHPTAAQRDFLAKTEDVDILGAALKALPAGESGSGAPRRATDRVAYIVHNAQPYSSGGYATRGHGVAKGLKEAGFDITVVCRPGFPYDLDENYLNQDLIASQSVDGIEYQLIRAPLRKGLKNTTYIKSAADELTKHLRDLNPDYIIAASNHLTAMPALIAAKRLNLPFFYEVRGFWEITRISREPDFQNTAAFRFAKHYETEVAVHADHVFTLTNGMRSILIDRGVTKDKISLVPNSCDPSEFTPRDRDNKLAEQLSIPESVPVIGYVGTFVHYEGLELLVEACGKLKNRGIEFRLLLVGNENASGGGLGPISENIQRIARDFEMEDWVIMTGRVPFEKVPNYYSLIDIAPFPRLPMPVTEIVSPMKPIEAMAMKKAVVVSSVAALAEMVEHGRTGEIFEKGNANALADALDELIVNSEYRLKIGTEARDFVKNHRTWNSVGKTFKEKIKEFGVPVLPAAQNLTLEKKEEIFSTVRNMYFERDQELGKTLFSESDWVRTKTVFELVSDLNSVVDIGLGQGQLSNLLTLCPNMSRVVGVDMGKHSKLIMPQGENFSFVEWDITTSEAPFAPADVVVAMEVLEHIDVDKVEAAFAALRRCSRYGVVFLSVPYQEKYPLYHHDRPHGHKQSFDDSKVERLFASDGVYTSLLDKWYLIAVFSDHPGTSLRKVDLDDFVKHCQVNLTPVIDKGTQGNRT